jgi:hypothetical protein
MNMIASFEYLGLTSCMKSGVMYLFGMAGGNKLSGTLYGGLLPMRSKTWCTAHSGIQDSIQRKSNVMRKWRSVPVTKSEMRKTSQIFDLCIVTVSPKGRNEKLTLTGKESEAFFFFGEIHVERQGSSAESSTVH